MSDLVRKLLWLLTPREKRGAVLLCCAMLVGSMLEMVGVGAIPVFIATLTAPDALMRHHAVKFVVDHAGITSPERMVAGAAAALLVLFVFKNVYLASLSYVQARYVFNRQVSIARKLFEAYLCAPYTMHLRRNSAELLRGTNHDAMQIVGAGLMPVLQLVMEFFTVSSLLLLLLVIEPMTSLAAFVILGGTTGLFLRVVRGRLQSAGDVEHQQRQAMFRSVNEGLGGIKVTKVLGREEYFLNRFSRAAEGYAGAARVRQLFQESSRLVLETVAIAGLLAVAALLVAQGRSMASLIPTLALLGVAVVRMTPSFNRITASFGALRYGRASAATVYKDLEELPGRIEPRAEKLPFAHRIRLDKVTFCYDASARASLTDVSIEVPIGRAVGIVGATGAGKTTLIDVILGLLQPSGGAVRVDGESIAGRERAWQRQIGYVPQDTYLADTSIRKNIAFGVPDDEVDAKAIEAAVRAAQLGDFVATLPSGLETVVGERGVRLSGGQRQRVGIARALYHNPAVLILDEATSSLDNATERYVMEAVERLRGERTLIIIAHRLSTVQACDCLYFLRDGHLAASGTYAELMQHSTDFNKMLAVAEPPADAPADPS